MIAAQLTFALAWIAIKYLGENIPLFEIIFFRSLIGLLVTAPLTYFRTGTLKGKNYPLLLLRGLTGLLAMIGAFYAMIHMNIGDAALLFNTAPLFVAILAPIFLKEKITKFTFLWIAVAFIGLALILKPTSGLLEFPALIALLAGFIISVTIISIRKLHKTDGALTITLYFSIFITVCSAPFALSDFVFPSGNQWILIIIVGVFVTFAQLLLTQAFKYAPASAIAPFGYMSVLFSYIFGIILWAEIPDYLSIIGTILVITGGVAVTKIASKKLSFEKDVVPIPPSSRTAVIIRKK